MSVHSMVKHVSEHWRESDGCTDVMKAFMHAASRVSSRFQLHGYSLVQIMFCEVVVLFSFTPIIFRGNVRHRIRSLKGKCVHYCNRDII